MENRDSLEELLTATQRQNMLIWQRDIHIQMVSAFNWKNRSPWALGRRSLSDQFLLVPTVGQFKVKLKSTEFVVKTGEAFFAQKGLEHQLEIDNCDELEQVSLHFDVFDDCRNDFDMNIFTNHFKLSNFLYWADRFRRLVHVINHEFEEGVILGSNLIREYFMSDLLKIESPISNNEILDYRIKLVVDFIQNNFNDSNLSVVDLSKKSGVKEVQFRRLFKRSLGITPKDYLIEYRVSAACKLLRSSAFSIKEIAYRVGFSQSDYFYHVFKKHKRVTPALYREQFFNRF